MLLRASPYLSWDMFWMLLFYGVALSAASITGYGTHEFYALILGGILATSATVVVTGGILLLGIAGTLSRDPRLRSRYYIGMGLLLIIEATAQYFYSQATFATKVAAKFAELALSSGQPVSSGSDLYTLASSDWGRVLPVAYIAILSAVVVYFDVAASERVKSIRHTSRSHYFKARLAEARQLRLSRRMELERLSQDAARDDLARRLAQTEHDLFEARSAARDRARERDALEANYLTFTAGLEEERNGYRELISAKDALLRQQEASIYDLQGQLNSAEALNQELSRSLADLEAGMGELLVALPDEASETGSNDAELPPITPELVWHARNVENLSWSDMQARFGRSQKTMRKYLDRYQP